MELVEFDEVTATFAKNQRQYRPLPAHVGSDGRVTCCWRLSEAELAEVQRTGVIWHQIETFGSALQPQLLSTEKPI